MKQVGEQWRLLSKEQRASWCFDPPARNGGKLQKRNGGATEIADGPTGVSLSPPPSSCTSSDCGQGAMLKASAANARVRDGESRQEPRFDLLHNHAVCGGDFGGAGAGGDMPKGASFANAGDLLGLGRHLVGSQVCAQGGSWDTSMMQHQVNLDVLMRGRAEQSMSCLCAGPMPRHQLASVFVAAALAVDDVGDDVVVDTVV